MSSLVDPNDFIITRKRKKYRFALFANSPLCFEVDQWPHNAKPNVLEMGAGTALFGVELAKSSPQDHVLAVDVKADRLQVGAKKAIEEGISTINFLRARADQLEALLVPRSFDHIWVTFPDPFPKSRSAKHRLTHPQFLGVYKTLLARDGALYFKTDARDLFLWSLEQLVREGWRIEELSFDLHESDLPLEYKIMTTYEERYHGEDIPINFIKAYPPRT